MEVVYVGPYNQAKIAYPALFYTDLEDESPLYVENPHNAPRWNKNIVIVVEDENVDRVYLVGETIDQAIENLASTLFNMEKVEYKYLSASWYDPEADMIYDDILPGEKDELYEIAVWDKDYSYTYGKDHIGWIKMTGNNPHDGTCICSYNVPRDTKLNVLYKLAKELFEA